MIKNIIIIITMYMLFVGTYCANKMGKIILNVHKYMPHLNCESEILKFIYGT